jgi:hypothetical protein
MSLLTDGPHTVTIIPMVITGKTKYGTWATERGEGIVRSPENGNGVAVEPWGAGSLSGLESADETSINDQFSVRGVLPWEGGTKSIIVWDGNEYDQIGLPKEYTRGTRTQHFVVRMKRRSAPVQ